MTGGDNEGIRVLEELVCQAIPDSSLGIDKSTTNTAIDGREDPIGQAQEQLLRMGRQRLGPPAPETEERIRGITELQLLQRLGTRLLHAASWQDLLSSV